MDTKTLASGFKITNLFLMETSFRREAQIDFDAKDIKNEVNIDVDVTVQGKIIVVTEALDFKRLNGERQEVSSQIKMVGVFEKIGESELDVEDFGYVNGAAIIFPFIREHLMNLSAKSGIGLIALPPMNFTRKKRNI